MKKLSFSPQNGRSGVDIFLPEGVDLERRPTPGTLTHIGVICKRDVYEFQRDEGSPTAWMLLKNEGDVKPLSNCLKIGSWGAGFNATAVHLIACKTGSTTILEEIGYKGRSSKIRLWEQSEEQYVDAPSLLVKGVIDAGDPVKIIPGEWEEKQGKRFALFDSSGERVAEKTPVKGCLIRLGVVDSTAVYQVQPDEEGPIWVSIRPTPRKGVECGAGAHIVFNGYKDTCLIGGDEGMRFTEKPDPFKPRRTAYEYVVDTEAKLVPIYDDLMRHDGAATNPGTAPEKSQRAEPELPKETLGNSALADALKGLGL